MSESRMYAMSHLGAAEAHLLVISVNQHSLEGKVLMNLSILVEIEILPSESDENRPLRMPCFLPRR